MITIFVGDCTEELVVAAKQLDQNASLIEHSNANQILVSGTYYTSLSDLNSIPQFIKILNQADCIVYTPPVKWSDTKKNFSYQQHWTEFYCLFFNDKKIVKGLDKIESLTCTNIMLEVVDARKVNKPQLWVAGCSISYGDGVKSSERYGELLSKRLDLPASFLTRPGTSIGWAADQILRSDIRSGDTVVWGLTSVNRFTFLNEDCSISNVNIRYYDEYPEFNNIVPLDFISYEKNNIFNSLRDVYKVINFCNKQNIRLFLAGLLIDVNSLKYFYNLPNFLQFYGVNGVNKNQIYLDLGSDNNHPGPLTHQWYADLLYTKITK